MSKRQGNKSQLIREIEKLKPHDHLCLIYESEEEWKAAAIPYISIGLESGQKCIYVCDNYTAGNLRQLLEENGTDVSTVESSGQLVITQESDTYTRGGKFDPDLMIELLIEETNKAISQGYPALRVTGEMTWVLKGKPGSERVLEYEAKLNRDLFPHYPCLAICQYDRWKFDPEIIKGVIMTHPKLIHGTRVSDNFYYISTEEFLNHKRAEVEAQHWLNNIAREEKRKEELVKTEIRYRRLFEAAKDGIIILDADNGIIRDINPYLLDLMGYSKQEILGKRLWELGLFKDRFYSQDSFRELQEKGYIHYDDLPLETKEGSKVDVEFVSNSYLENSHMVIQCNIRNITGRKQAERELKLMAELLDNTVDAIFLLLTLDGKLIYVNGAACHSLGYSKDELLKLDLSAITAPGVNVEVQWKQLLEKGQAVFESAQLRKDGSVMPVEVHARIIEVENTKRVLSVTHDITERKQAEQSLRDSEEKLRLMFDAVPEGITVTDLDGKILETNEVVIEMHGYDNKDELIGRNSLVLIEESDRNRASENLIMTLEQEQTSLTEYTFVRKDESVFPAELSASVLKDGSGNTVGFIAITRDITDRKKAEAEKRELERKAQMTDRLASVGEMASGVAHEINNPLTGVVGFSELLMEKALPEDIREEVKIIHDGSRRVADIVKRLLSFARQQKPVRTRTDINEIIENTLTLRKYALETSNIEVKTLLHPELPWTVVDAGQLQQVFMNLIVNAEAEMKRAHSGGRLIVQTQQTGDMIRISFKDDGPGIARENLEKVFEPFFTTKPVGEGTGLGLSLAHGIIAEHKGNLYVESEKGRGATFFVEIPLVSEEGQKEDSPDEETAGSEATGGRILVIDDEPGILSLLKEVLTREGYDVEMADNGKEALEMIGNTRYSAILCDIKLPEMGGKDIYEKMGEIAPSLKKRVIFMTGDVIGADTAAFLKKAKAPYLNKPVDINILKKEVNRVITGGG